MNNRGQGAWEFLVTWGWAIFIVMIVGVVVWQITLPKSELSDADVIQKLLAGTDYDIEEVCVEERTIPHIDYVTPDDCPDWIFYDYGTWSFCYPSGASLKCDGFFKKSCGNLSYEGHCFSSCDFSKWTQIVEWNESVCIRYEAHVVRDVETSGDTTGWAQSIPCNRDEVAV